MERLRESGPLWVVLGVFIAAFGVFALMPLEQTVLERYAAQVRLMATSGILVGLVIGLCALASQRLRGLGQRLRQNLLLVVSSALSVVLLFALATLLGQPSAAGLALGLVVTTAGVSAGVARILISRAASQGSIAAMPLAQLFGQAVWHDGGYFFVTPEGKYQLPDEATAKFLGSARGVLRDVRTEDLLQMPTIAGLQSVRQAALVQRRDSADHFFILKGEDGRKYKAHISSMSAPVDFRPDLDVSKAEVWPPHDLQDCVTLR